MVVVGGGSLMPGLVDRINLEMGLRFPGAKIKIHSPGNTVERKYSAWLGGSILASLGTFHQLWVAAEEWKEHGPSILRQSKCFREKKSLVNDVRIDTATAIPLFQGASKYICVCRLHFLYS
jgi:hypothetical protein